MRNFYLARLYTKNPFIEVHSLETFRISLSTLVCESVFRRYGEGYEASVERRTQYIVSVTADKDTTC